MDSWQAAGILALAAGLPLALLLRRQERLLLLWICITTGVNVFDARVGVNLPAARLVGLIVLAFVPLGALHVRRLLRTRRAAKRVPACTCLYVRLLGPRAPAR